MVPSWHRVRRRLRLPSPCRVLPQGAGLVFEFRSGLAVALAPVPSPVRVLVGDAEADLAPPALPREYCSVMSG
jgi:hypothetical protein